VDRVRKILAKHGIDAGVEDIGGYENYMPYFIRVGFGTAKGLPPFVLKGKEAAEFNCAWILDAADHGEWQKVQAVREVLTQEEIDEIHKQGAVPWFGLQ